MALLVASREVVRLEWIAESRLLDNDSCNLNLSGQPVL